MSQPLRRLPALLAVATAALAVPLPASAGAISLRIAFRADAQSAPVVRTLRCSDRTTGTVPRPREACTRLQRLGDAVFAPVPRDTVCTQISGGPSTARVTGVYFGRPLWVTLRRTNGCEIDRWSRVAFLLPRPAAPR